MKKQIRIVLRELDDRLPKNNKEGFMPDPKVVEAIKELKQYLREKKAGNS